MIFILPYKLGSESARELAINLGAKRIAGHKRLPNSSVVINWGNSEVHPINNRRMPVRIINKPSAVKIAANKLETLKRFTECGVPTVEYTTDKQQALSWLQDDEVVMCRKYLNSSQGAGIEIVFPEDDFLPTVPLYTKLLGRAHEYRVHVAFGKVIDFSKKKRRNDIQVNDYIKNHNNGWVFCREATILPEKVKQACIKAVAAVGLDFGALDVLYKERDDRVAVLEINTAPGIQESTLRAYINFFRSLNL